MQKAGPKENCGTTETRRLPRSASPVTVGGLPPARIQSRERRKRAASEVPEPPSPPPPPPTPTVVIPPPVNNLLRLRAPQRPAAALGLPPSRQQAAISRNRMLHLPACSTSRSLLQDLVISGATRMSSGEGHRFVLLVHGCRLFVPVAVARGWLRVYSVLFGPDRPD